MYNIYFYTEVLYEIATPAESISVYKGSELSDCTSLIKSHINYRKSGNFGR